MAPLATDLWQKVRWRHNIRLFAPNRVWVAIESMSVTLEI
jgi:hypothetical protein